MADLWRDFWIPETGTFQQVAQPHDIYDDDDVVFVSQMLTSTARIRNFNIVPDKFNVNANSLCAFWVSHSSVAEDTGLLGYYPVSTGK
jgi:hypothetical protein